MNTDIHPDWNNGATCLETAGILNPTARESDRVTLDLGNGCELDLDINPHHGRKRFSGIRGVRVDGFPLRCEQEAICPEIGTPDGCEVDFFECLGLERSGAGWWIHTRPWFRTAHRMEYSEHALHLRIGTGSWSNGPWPVEAGRFHWRIEPQVRMYDGRTYCGFSYGFTYAVPGQAIYQIEDKATWELGGTAVGNRVIQRGGTMPPPHPFEEGDTWDSGMSFEGIDNPYGFSHLPLYTALSGFTFQTGAGRILLTVHEHPSHVRSLFHREAGDPKLLHFHQFCFDLTEQATTPARLLHIAAAREDDDTRQANHYLRVRDTLHREIRAYYGVRLDAATPSAHVETWDIARMQQFPMVFRQLHAWGIGRAFLMPLWRSNETDVLPRFREDRERFGVLGNMCCPLELEIADCYGVWHGFADLMASARDADVPTYMWFGSHFSSLSPLAERIPDLFARDVSGQCQRNNYGHVLFAVDQTNGAYRAYLLDAFRRAADLGLSGVFRDSHFNMASDTIHFTHRPVRTVRSMHDAEASIQAAFQHELNLLYYVESAGVLGTPMCGIPYADIRGREYLFGDMDCGMEADAVIACGDDPLLAWFRSLSVRLIWQIQVEVNQFPAPGSVSSWWQPDRMAPIVRAFRQVERLLGERTVLPQGLGILWHGGMDRVLFAWRDGLWDFPKEAPVTEVVSGSRRPGGPSLPVEACRMYRYRMPD